MKTYLRILLLVVVLGSFASLAILSFAQRVAPPAGQAGDLPLYLNGEAVGSVADTRPLVNRLKALDAKVNRNANLPDGGIPTVGRVILHPDDKLPMAGFGRIWDSVTDYFGFPPFEGFEIWNGDSCTEKSDRRPRPIYVLSNAPMSTDDLKKARAGDSCALQAEVYTSTVQWRYYARYVKSYRLYYSSLEITDSGSYALNEQAKDERSRISPNSNLGSPALGRRVDAAIVKQRPLAADAVEKEIAAWIDRRAQEGSEELSMDEGVLVLPIIASSKASYAALSHVLSMVHRANVRLVIVIN